jgi:ribosomal protein S18 acetylase RimI-like enzyme
MIMQQINLHQPVTRRKRTTLTARGAGGSMLAIVVAMLGLWAFAWWQLHQMRAEVELVRAQRAAAQALEAAQSAQFDVLSQEQLDALISDLGSTVATKERALAQVSADSGPAAAFSERLGALSRRHVDDVWLDRLTLGSRRDAMSLSGAALTPEAVPRYLQSLAADPALRGAGIDQFVIDRAGKKRGSQLRFRATTRQLPVAEPAVDPATEG